VNLTIVIGEHPEFRETLLSKTLVPFIEECEGAKPTVKSEMICRAYFEMITMLDPTSESNKTNKLDASKLNEVKTLDGFTKALSNYNQEEIEVFCSKFPSWIPKDLKEYPESTKLHKFVSNPTKCQALCSDIRDADAVTAKPICRVFAIGYHNFINTTVSVQQNIGNELKDNLLDKIQETETSAQKTADATNPEASLQAAKSEPKHNQVSSSIGATGSALEVQRKDSDKVTDDKTVEKVDEDSPPVVMQNNQLLREELSRPMTSTSQTKENETPISKSETNHESVEPIPKGIKAQPPLEEAVDKQSVKPVTDVDDTLIENNDIDEANKLNYIEINKDKPPMFNEDDSTEEFDENKPIEENADNGEFDLISQNVPHKFPQDQTPSREQLLGSQSEDPFYDDTDSNFFTYFMFLLLICVIAYVVYHNKTKMLALMLEGRRSSTNGRSGLTRRKHTAAYRKLDSNLEEAITSSANGRSAQVIY